MNKNSSKSNAKNNSQVGVKKVSASIIGLKSNSNNRSRENLLLN